MARASAIVLVFAALFGCSAVPPREAHSVCVTSELGDWLAFMNQIDDLDETALMDEYRSVLQRLLVLSDDADRLRLSYLLSRPGLPVRNVDQSRALVAEVDPEGACGPYRDLMSREIARGDDLESIRRSARELRSQLEALKGIDTDLTRGQQELEELSQ